MERRNHVETCKNGGKMEEIGNARVQVVAVQGSRLPAHGRSYKKDFSLFCSGPKERTGRYGARFVINAKTEEKLPSFEPLSDRLCKLSLRGKFRNITLISTYAPTENSPDAIKDAFYDQLNQECEKARKYDILILMGDFNSKIGR
jgi:exonuclease III